MSVRKYKNIDKDVKNNDKRLLDKLYMQLFVLCTQAVKSTGVKSTVRTCESKIVLLTAQVKAML